MDMSAKQTLIKSLAQSLTTHVMSIFKMPTGFHDDYMKTLRVFWWGEDNNKRRLHCASWDKLTDPKNARRDWFRDSAIFKQAPLARQGWRG